MERMSFSSVSSETDQYFARLERGLKFIVHIVVYYRIIYYIPRDYANGNILESDITASFFGPAM